MNIKNIFKSKKRKAREAEKAAHEAQTRAVQLMIDEYWQVHRDVYSRILRRRTRHSIDSAWHWAGRYADEYMTRKYAAAWVERNDIDINNF